MSKAKELIELIESLNEAVSAFTKKSLDTYKKVMSKDGTRVTTTGKITTIYNPKTKKKVVVKDTGRNVKITRTNKGKSEKETSARGLPDDANTEVSWVGKKE